MRSLVWPPWEFGAASEFRVASEMGGRLAKPLSKVFSAAPRSCKLSFSRITDGSDLSRFWRGPGLRAGKHPRERRDQQESVFDGSRIVARPTSHHLESVAIVESQRGEIRFADFENGGLGAKAFSPFERRGKQRSTRAAAAQLGTHREIE